jgi:hypothetical protein
VVHRRFAVAGERVDAGDLPVADGQVLLGAIGSLGPVPQRGHRAQHHRLIVVARAFRLLDQFPRAIETLGRKTPMRRGGVEG